MFCILAAGPAPLQAQSYQLTDLGTLGGSSSQANGISENGTVAGHARTAAGGQLPVMWNDVGIVSLGPPPGFAAGSAVAVNNAGQVACYGAGSPQAYQAFLWESGTWTPLGTLPGHADAIAEDIDSSGRIVGRSFTLGQSATGRAFIWEQGVLTSLGTLGGSSQAYGINDAGDVVGYSQVNLPEGGQSLRAFLWRNGIMMDIGVLPGEDHSWAYEINDQGEVAGKSWHTTTQFLAADQAALWRNDGAEIIDLGLTPGPPVCVFEYPFYTANSANAVNNIGQVVGDARCIASGGSRAAFLWQNGVMHNLNDLIPSGSGWELLSAQDINDAGQIVGLGIEPGGQLRAFLLTPEPTAVGGTPNARFALRVFPNPFNGETHIAFELPEAARVRLVVYDVRGRPIATLVNGARPRGPQSVRWTARDDEGAPVSTGVYFARLDGSSRTETRKLIVTR